MPVFLQVTLAMYVPVISLKKISIFLMTVKNAVNKIKWQNI
jgi:hypothetical protein